MLPNESLFGLLRVKTKWEETLWITYRALSDTWLRNREAAEQRFNCTVHIRTEWRQVNKQSPFKINFGTRVLSAITLSSLWSVTRTART